MIARRNKRRIAAARFQAPKVVESRYVLKLRRIMEQAHAHILKQAGIRHDSAKQHGSIVVANVKVQAAVRKPVGAAFDEMFDGVERANRLALQNIPLMELGFEDTIREYREWNISLISQAVDDYSHEIIDVLNEQEDEGLRVEVLAKRLEERAEVSKNRAEFIARDQTLKINGQINQTRQRAAGISRYTWNTSHDERVRDTHRELDGTMQSWDNPPDIDGESLNPGEDFQCRCVAIPIFEEDESGEDE